MRAWGWRRLGEGERGLAVCERWDGGRVGDWVRAGAPLAEWAAAAEEEEVEVEDEEMVAAAAAEKPPGPAMGKVREVLGRR